MKTFRQVFTKDRLPTESGFIIAKDSTDNFPDAFHFDPDLTNDIGFFKDRIEWWLEEQPALSDDPMLGVVRVRWDDFMVHLKTDEFTLYFEVYPVQDWTHLPTGKEGMSYIDKENEPETREEFETGKCLMKLEGSYCWRGVWEGRLYFPDQEYWGEDIEELSRLYNDCIVPWCKDFIQKREGRELIVKLINKKNEYKSKH